MHEFNVQLGAILSNVYQFQTYYLGPNMPAEDLAQSCLDFAAFFIATTTNSVATNGSRQSFMLKQELACKDYLGLEKIFSQVKSTEGESIPLKVKVQCKN